MKTNTKHRVPTRALPAVITTVKTLLRFPSERAPFQTSKASDAIRPTQLSKEYLNQRLALDVSISKAFAEAHKQRLLL